MVPGTPVGMCGSACGCCCLRSGRERVEEMPSSGRFQDLPTDEFGRPIASRIYDVPKGEHLREAKFRLLMSGISDDPSLAHDHQGIPQTLLLSIGERFRDRFLVRRPSQTDFTQGR